jgi:hypothetical protein
MLAPRLPFALAPLIAEAKSRMRRRRLTALLLVLAGAGAVTFALWPSGGGASGTRPTERTQPSRSLAQLTVPLDPNEREWRSKMRSLSGPAASPAAVVKLRKRVLSLAAATGATVVRIRIWRRTSPAAAEVVFATRLRPAVYLRHRAKQLLSLSLWPHWVEVVDPSGKYFLEESWAGNEGSVGVRPDLWQCSPFQPVTLLAPPPPCPVK